MRIKITNDFHGTEVTLLASVEAGILRLTPRQVSRARRELCGHAGCTCGGYLGERGALIGAIVPTRDGGAAIAGGGK
jgi:hypothetical protein